MKKLLALTLAALMLAAALASCAATKTTSIPANIRVTSSDAADAAEWLAARLGEISDKLVIGTNTDGLNLDLRSLKDDGYLIRNLDGEIALLAKTADGLDRAARAYAKTVESGEPIADVTYHEGFRVKSLTIAGNDVSTYAIVIPDGADKCVKNSANVLSEYVCKSCGFKLPVYEDSYYNSVRCEEGDRCILSDHRIVFTSGDETLGDEGFTITVDEEGDLHIDGGVYRGCLFGVYDLLEENVGWRFPGAAFIPDDKREYLNEVDHIDITSDANRTEIPSVAIRGGTGVLGNKDTYATKDNAKLGGYGFPVRCCHGLENNHDLIFSGEYEGLYLGWNKTGYQPCFTNEDILEAIDNYAINYVQSRLEAGQQIGREIVDVDVAQWDSGPYDFCSCKNCAALRREEGSDSGAVVRMANRVAALMDERSWDVTVSILAYYGTDVLPKKARPAHNVLVSYCFFAGVGYCACSNHCISGVDCSASNEINNAVPAERFEQWVEVMDPQNIQVWYYPLNWRKITYNSPIYTVLLDDMKYLASKGVGHVYLCHSSPADGVTNVELSKYLCGKYLWDASITEDEADALILDWFETVYGKEAGYYLYECAMLQEYAADIAGCWGVLGGNHDHVDYGYMARHGDEVWNLYEKAVAAAGSADEQRIIENYMAGVLYTVVVGGYDSMYVNGTEAERETLVKWYTELYRLFRDNKLPIVADVYHVSETGKYLTGEVDLTVDPHTWMDAPKD